MNYTRSEESRKNQSETMKVVSKTMDYQEIAKKAKATRLEKGIRNGRKPHPTINKTCDYCGSSFQMRDTKNGRATKYCNSTCYNGSKKGKVLPYLVCKDKSYMKTEAYSKAKSKPDVPAYKRYKNKVHKLSEQTYVKHIEIINPNGYPRTLCGVDGGWQLDHIKSVRK
jgi:hypothetical protein